MTPSVYTMFVQLCAVKLHTFIGDGIKYLTRALLLGAGASPHAKDVE